MQKLRETITTRGGAALAHATVTVTLMDGTVPALYSNNLGTPLPSNVLTTDNNGLIECYGPDGRYRLIATKTGYQTQIIEDILLEDPVDGRQSVGVYEYGAVGDGVTDDTAAIQSAITTASARGGVVTFLAKTYLCQTIYVPSNVTLRGQGAGTVLKASASLPLTSCLVQNANVSTYTDGSIGLSDLTIDGNNLGAGASQTRTTALVSFSRVSGLSISRVKVFNHQYQGIALLGCRRVRVVECELTALGYSGTTSNGGSAIWVGSYSADMSQDVIVSGCQIHDNNWHGMHLAASRGTVSACHFKTNKEAHIYAPRTTPNTDTSKIRIDACTFDGVTKKDVSAHAIETTARRVVISNNVVENCDHGGIALQNAQEVVVSGNVISNVNLENTTWCGIDIITDNAAPDQPKDITITGNRIFDDQGTVTTYAAVGIINSGAAVTALTMAANNFGGVTFKSGSVFVTNSKLGANCKVRANVGLADTPVGPAFGQFSVSVTGSLSVTGLGFKPTRLKIHAIIPASAKESQSWIDAAGNMYCHNLTSTATPAAYGGTSSYAVNVTDGAGSAQVRATFTSYDTDGFTLNFSTVGTTTWCVYEAYPE